MADELIDETAGPELVVGIDQDLAAHADLQARGHVCGAARRADMVLVVVAIEEVVVEPARAACAEVAAAVGEVRVADVAGHFFAGAQGGQIPEAHLWVGPVVFDVHGVVLTTFHDAVLIGVPAALYPAERERLFD